MKQSVTGLAGEDGIVCLAAKRGEHSAADRVRELLSAAFGSDWSAARERELLTVAGDGKEGAGILRWKPNIKWKKDRGKEPKSLRPKADFPWFWGCNGEGIEADRTDFPGGTDFDGNRWNDLHYSLALKQEAREAKEENS